MQLILASKSPRRKELLETLDLSFKIQTDDSVDENQVLTETALSLPDRLKKLAMLKGRAVSLQYPQAVVISADTIVVLGETIFGKPANKAEARLMLAQLSGKVHKVHTAVCFQRKQDGMLRTVVDSTEVTFLSLSPEVIEQYTQQVYTLDKAGAYAIQEHGEMVVECISGDYNTVVGLPLGPTVELLRQFNVVATGLENKQNYKQ